MNEALQKREQTPLDRVQGTYSAAEDANSRMSWAAKNGHLISPASSVGAMPEGVGLALTVVAVDVDADTYDQSGQRGLGKSTLQKIAHAVGLSWDSEKSGRVDDGSHPYYVRWKSVGTFRAFDGQEQVLCAEKELDLRDGSPVAVKASAKQLGEMRMHAQAHAETKAQLRAIRSLGIKTSYSREELKKPFVAARVLFTGQTSDPALKRIFAERTADAFLGSRDALFGAAPTPAAPAMLAPPPVGTVPSDPDDHAGFLAPVEQPPEPSPVQPERQAAKPQRSTERQPGEASGFVVLGGRSKGTPIEQADDSDLEYWVKRLAESLDAGESRSPERDQDIHDAMVAELGSRA